MYIEMQTHKSSLPQDSKNRISQEQHDTPKKDLNGDLSVTALYTAETWHWAGFDYAEQVVNVDSERVFKVTNFALSIMRLFRWNLPKLAPGLAQRHSLIDQLSQERSTRTIIELASGLSTRSYRLCYGQAANTIEQYIEIDLPHVLNHKKKLLHRAGNLPKALQFHALDLKLFEASTFKKQFSLSEINLVIAEGLVMYLKADELKLLLGQVSDLLKASHGRFIFDWVPSIEEPSPGFIGRTLAYLMKLFTGGESFERDQRTRQDMVHLLYDLGAKKVELYDTQLIAKSRNLPFANTKTQQLVFCVDF